MTAPGKPRPRRRTVCRLAPPPAAAARRHTLDRVLSKGGVVSRTEAAALIRAGRVRLDGRVERDPGTWVDPKEQRVLVDGEPLRAPRRTCILLCKPKGVVTTARDPAGRRTVFDLLPPREGHLFPVGRLDLDTSGLLLLTNDSALAEALTNPAHEVPKTYLVKASTRLDEEQLDALRRGVTLADGPTRPAEITRLREPGGRTVLEMTIREGRNRQVRRMIEAVGSKVLKLVRVRIGPLELGEMKPGDWRELSREETAALQRAASRRMPARKDQQT